jgi:formamidopyrimidine-DNA glycosylase
MPELAEVYYYAQQWDAGRNKPVRRIELHGSKRVFRGCDTRALEDRLVGGRLLRIHTHGKQMLFEFSRGCWLGVHLGMTGKLSTVAQPFEPGRHDHLVLHLSERALVFTDARQFGRISFHHGKRMPGAWTKLPPQPMDAGFTARRVAGILKRHARQPLKALLLDQRYFPGIGNWMADEVLWQARLHPARHAGSLDEKDAATLRRVMRKVCAVALRTIGVDWGDPPRTWLFGHRWEDGGACPRCGGTLIRRQVRGRTACWCAACQRP